MANRTYATLQTVVSEVTGAPGSTGRGAYLAGLGINEAIDEANMLTDVWFLQSLANVSLTSGNKTYVLSTSWPNFSTHVRSAILNSAGTRVEKEVKYVTPEDFYDSRYETTDQSGAPDVLTVDTFNDLIRINRDPGTTYNNRTLRTLYYRKLSRLSISTATLGVDDSTEAWIVADAKWRARQYAGVDDWPQYKAHADVIRKRLLAKPQSVDFMALGLRGF